MGYVELKKQNQILRLDLNFDSFALTQRLEGYNSSMYSAYLAECVDDILFSKSEIHLPEKYKQMLSGEEVIAKMKRDYRILQQSKE